ncbi:MAG: LytR C-terminal domain-containing protein, partial [Solirubrobacteraceae bacterium]
SPPAPPGEPRRPPAPETSRRPAPAAAQTARSRPGVSPLLEERRRPNTRRSPGKTTLLILAAVIAVVAIAVVVLSSGGGGSPSKGSSSTTGSSTVGTGKTTTTAHHKATKTSAHAANPAETIVAVLNGTERAGLAHQVSGQLQQGGYSQAEALSGRPAGTNQATVVQYASGHRGDAEGVARTLGVTQVQPLESAVASLAGSAKVVVIVGADKAAAAP